MAVPLRIRYVIAEGTFREGMRLRVLVDGAGPFDLELKRTSGTAVLQGNPTLPGLRNLTFLLLGDDRRPIPGSEVTVPEVVLEGERAAG